MPNNMNTESHPEKSPEHRKDIPGSGSAMDRKVKKRVWTLPRIIGGIAALGFVFAVAYGFVTYDGKSRLNVDRERLTIHTVESGVFQEYIPIVGRVTPRTSVYLDAIEGGVIQDIFLESGDLVDSGDTILTLSNSRLQLDVLNREAQLYEQINNIRNTRITLEQRTLQLKGELAEINYHLDVLKPQFQRQQQLMERGLISEKNFEEVREQYEYYQKRRELTYNSYHQDSLLQRNRMQQLTASENRLWRSLDAVQHILDNLVVTAPIAGQLSTDQLEVGQSITAGQRIGQVDILNSFKARAEIDEHYLSRITKGLSGEFTFADHDYTMHITKVYPTVTEGTFEVELEFTGEEPGGIRSGQTLHIRLELGNPESSLLVARGGFFQKTGGNWIYRLEDGENTAVRRSIRLGRQNPEFFEVREGLQPGDKVITSSYDTFGDAEILILN